MTVADKWLGIFFVSMVIFPASSVGLASYYNGFDERYLTTEAACAFMYLQMVFTVAVVVLPGRIARYSVNFDVMVMF